MLGKLRRVALYVGALGALSLGGAALASATSSTTTTPQTTTPQTTTTTPPSTSTTSPPLTMPAPGTTAHESAEKAVTGAQAAKVQAAAIAIVGSGTAGTVTTDYQGSGYEVTVTKPDGTKVPLLLNSSLQQITGPGGGHCPGGVGTTGAATSASTGAPPPAAV